MDPTRSMPVAWRSSDPEPWPPHPLLNCCSSRGESGWRWRWPSGSNSRRRAAAKRCRWMRICVQSWISAGPPSWRAHQLVCSGRRCKTSWGWCEPVGLLPPVGAGMSSLERYLNSPLQSYQLLPCMLRDPVVFSVRLLVPPWHLPISGSRTCLSPSDRAASAALPHAIRVKPLGPHPWHRSPTAASSLHPLAGLFIHIP